MAYIHLSRRFLSLLGLYGLLTGGEICRDRPCLSQTVSHKGHGVSAAGSQSLRLHFEYATNRNSILVQVKVNDTPAVLVVDTGSSHTVVRPELLHIKSSELMPTRQGSSGGGFLGDAIGREITLQVGSWKWQKRRVAVMDLSQVLEVYQQQIDGVLGLDFVQEFSCVTINVKDKTILFVR